MRLISIQTILDADASKELNVSFVSSAAVSVVHFILPRFGEGGPAVYSGRDRAFFFFSYEGLRENTTSLSTGYVETPQFRQAVINARPGGITAASTRQLAVSSRVSAGVLTPSCADVQGGIPCQVVGGGLDVGSLSGALGQYLTFGNLGGGGLDGIPDIQRVIIAEPRQQQTQSVQCPV